MAEVTTPQDGASGSSGDGGEPTPADASGSSDAGGSGADAFAAERAALQTRAREEQARADRLQRELEQARQTPPSTPSPAPTDQFLTRDDFRAELRRQREIDSAVGALKEQFPNAKQTFAKFDSYESVEAMRLAAENEQKAFNEQVTPAVEAAVAAALEPYVKRFGPLQAPPTGGADGAGQGLPTLIEVERMSLRELDALEKEHPGLQDRLLNEALSNRL